MIDQTPFSSLKGVFYYEYSCLLYNKIKNNFRKEVAFLLSKTRTYLLIFNLFWLVLLLFEQLLKNASNSNILFLLLSVLALVGLVFQALSWRSLNQERMRLDYVLYGTAWVLCFLFVLLL